LEKLSCEEVKNTIYSWKNRQPIRLAGGWWLVLICSERKILLTGCWWLVLICSERKILLTGCWWLVCSERKVGWWLISQTNRVRV
jgi:hypothetical protein